MVIILSKILVESIIISLVVPILGIVNFILIVLIFVFFILVRKQIVDANNSLNNLYLEKWCEKILISIILQIIGLFFLNVRGLIIGIALRIGSERAAFAAFFFILFGGLALLIIGGIIDILA